MTESNPSNTNHKERTVTTALQQAFGLDEKVWAEALEKWPEYAMSPRWDLFWVDNDVTAIKKEFMRRGSLNKTKTVEKLSNEEALARAELAHKFVETAYQCRTWGAADIINIFDMKIVGRLRTRYQKAVNATPDLKPHIEGEPVLKELSIEEKGVFGPWSIWTKLQFLHLLEDEKVKVLDEEMEDEDDDGWLDEILKKKQRTEESTSSSKQEEHQKRTKKRTLEATALIRNKDQKRQRLIDPKKLVGKKADREKVYVYTSD